MYVYIDTSGEISDTSQDLYLITKTNEIFRQKKLSIFTENNCKATVQNGNNLLVYYKSKSPLYIVIHLNN